MRDASVRGSIPFLLQPVGPGAYLIAASLFAFRLSLMPVPYGDDLAYIHDVGYDAFVRRAAPELLRLLEANGIADETVVDLGCGSGVWTQALIDAGYAAHGIDRSPAMIEIARERVPEATFDVASFLEAELPACGAVTAVSEVLGYIGDEPADDDRLLPLFERVYDALRPGGLFAFDLLEPGCVRRTNPQRRWQTGPDWATLVEVEEHPREALLTRRIIAFRQIGEHYRRSEEEHRMRLHAGPVLAAQLRRLGFEVQLARGYGGFRFERPGHYALIARKS